MSAIKNRDKKLPGQFDELVREMPPRAIVDDVHYQNMLEMIDRLMASGRLSKGQGSYLETLVQLVERYEAERHAIDTTGIKGLDILKHLVAENGINASELARLLKVHPSMGSKILKGERALTIDHIKTLAARFKVRAEAFIA